MPYGSEGTMTWTDVHAALEARRLDLDLLKGAWYRRLGISETTYRKMADGIPIAKVPKRRQIARAAGWTPESIDSILAGGDPTVAEPVSQPAGEFAQLSARVAELEAQVGLLLEVSNARGEGDPDWPRRSIEGEP